MSDNDLIRRGDALAAVQAAYDDSGFEPDLADANARIAALPPAKQDDLASGKAVTVGVRPLVDAVEALNAACDAMWNDHERLERNPDQWGQKMRIKERHVKAISEAQQRLPAILAALDLTPAPDTAAIREAAWKEVAALVRKWRNDVPMTGEECSNTILALLPKGGA